MLSVTDLCVSRGGRKLYHNFTLAFETEKTTVILAASGAGKTTLLDCLSGLLKPDSAGTPVISVVFSGKEYFSSCCRCASAGKSGGTDIFFSPADRSFRQGCRCSCPVFRRGTAKGCAGTGFCVSVTGAING